MLIFYDFEVFKYDWLVVAINPVENEKTIIINSTDKLHEFYNKHKNDIWIGFNSRGYDQHILKGILSGFNPYEISQWIIEKDKNGYSFNSAMNRIQLFNYDVSKGKTDYSLKTLEAFMGNNIKETSVPFNLNRKLTSEEITETIKYCMHDVEQTIEVFLKRKDDFDTQLGMINEFNLSVDNIGKTTPQLLSIILGAERVNDRDDDYNIRVPDTLTLTKYKHVADWFINSREAALSEYDGESDFAKHFYKRSLNIDVAGVEHAFAWGGVHAARPKYSYVCKPDEIMIMADVTSLYPSLMIEYDLQSRSIKDKSLFKKIYDTNVEMKKNKDPRRPIYKLACNMTYGSMGDKFNNLYDKLHQNLVCVYGQLVLLDLIEKLEPHSTLIQSNTDGILFKIKRKDFDLIDDIVYEWEQRTRLSMEFTYVNKIYQKDVNNYVMVTTDGKIKSKGAYVKSLSKLDNDLPIVNKAMVEYMVNDIPVETTINNCNELILFQKIVKLSGKYDYVLHNGTRYNWKSYRVFASKNASDGMIYKCKHDGKEPIIEKRLNNICKHDSYGWCDNKKSKYHDKKCPFVKNLKQCQDYMEYWYEAIVGETNRQAYKQDKFANTPECCFINNDDINGVPVPSNLDKQYYIDLAKDRLNQFGVL